MVTDLMRPKITTGLFLWGRKLIKTSVVMRVNIGFIVLAYGTAQDFNRWRERESPNNYLRMTLVNPF